jgi:hypothetical protein
VNLTFRPIADGRKPATWLAALKNKSGVYVIRELGLVLKPVLYVGESHTNNLRKTITRHFQKWTGKTAR